MSLSATEKPDDGDVTLNPLGLDEAELRCLSAQVDLPPSDAGYKSIYGYGNRADGIVMGISLVAAGASGAALPLMTILMGNLVGNFSDLSVGGSLNVATINHTVLYFVYLGIACLVLTSAAVYGFTWTGERITTRLRAAYLESLLRQNIAYLDSLGAGEVATRITADLNLVQDGISEKVALIFTGLGGVTAGLVVAFVKSWRLALVMLCLPLGTLVYIGIMGPALKTAMTTAVNRYAETSSFAEEAISSLRNVAAYGAQRRFVRRYEESLVPATQAEFKSKALMGVLLGGMSAIVLSSFALAPWAGSFFYAHGQIGIGEIFTVMFASLLAAVSFNLVLPCLQAVSTASVAANRVFAAIARQPTIEVDGSTGKRLEPLRGHVEFQHLRLVYPSRKHQLVLDDFSLDVPAGKTTAVVGPSGSGKSSLFYLMQAFYTPLRGQVLIDGADVRDCNLKWLRSNMRMVGQEPFLFATTIFENIAHGLVGTEYENSDAETKRKLVEEAAKTANAHEFITQLPQGYQTGAGAQGSLLSGGQRQRVAIARAVVSDPRILLLDEATAALDTKSESVVQKALNMRGAGGDRTTIVIAHRLSTVRHADKIVVMEHGQITEQGTHEELLAKAGTYASLAAAQSLQDDGDEEAEEEEGAGSGRKEAGTIVAEAEADPEAGISPFLLLGRRTTTQGSSTVVKSAQSTPQPLHEASTWSLIGFLLRLNRPEAGHLALGLVGSIFSGFAWPLTAVFFGNLILALREPALTIGGHGVGFWAGMQWFAAWTTLLAFVLQNVSFAFASSRLLSRARGVAFAAILRQDMAFFARPGNGAGALTAFLATQANLLNGLSGTILGAVLSSLCSLVAGIAVGVSFGWKLGLVGTALMPLIVLTGWARLRLLSDLGKKNLRNNSAAADLVSEAIRGVRTVAAMGLEGHVAGQYRRQLGEEMRAELVRDALIALLYGASQSVMIFATGLLFWYGGTRLLPTGEYDVRTYLICFMATTYGAQAAGGMFSYAPDVAGAREAVARLKALCETVPDIDVDDGRGAEADSVEGDVELRAVDFAYPNASAAGKTSGSTTHHLILRDVSLAADHGRFIALVGASGSGKSTVLNLLVRLYDPGAGRVLLGRTDIRELNLPSYRRQLAIVEQDAVLYSGTIRENIVVDDGAEEGDKAVERACRDANIWEFVQSLPDGLNTLVGPRGSQVSGGQKQRLALSRALLRNPKVLLLDEATSALDSHSEAVVQQALAAAAVGRTTIAVAHRLSSIAHADCIYVFDNGAVVESGTHAELMSRRGRYWEYVGMQNLDH